MAHPLHAAHGKTRILVHGYRNRQRAYRAEVLLRSLVSLIVQPFVLQFGRALLACLLMLLAMGPLAVHAAVLDEAAGRAGLELRRVAGLFAAVGAAVFDWSVTHWSEAGAREPRE